MNKHKQVIVVGAGMAGIAAGRTLHDAGVEVLLLEGRERIGGRTHTDYSLGTAVDLGGSWIHGPIGNPLTPLAEKFGVEMGYTDFDNETGEALLVVERNGRQVDGAAFGEGIAYFSAMMAHTLASELFQPEKPLSITEAITYDLPGVADLTPDQRLGFARELDEGMQLHDAADPDVVDWAREQDYVILPGGDMLLHGGGYSRIAHGLAEGLTIETAVAVHKISHDEDGVGLETSNGRYTAEHVIITVPIGVLKAGTITFAPELPAAKQAALDRLGMGKFEKLALRFPHRFWPTEPHYIDFLPESMSDLCNSWLNMAHYSGEPVLVVHHAGSRAELVNKMSDGELIETAMSSLQTMFGDDIPSPESYVRTSWAADPFSQGAYSYPKVGGQAADRKVLGEGINGRLFFAGEATHPSYFGTVHGAYETGVRAAREVLTLRM
ncbi:MAG: FAD-dependent oxidoreductase [Chloroflexota bacterium]